MTDECLSGLALLHMHHATEVDIPSVIQDFDATEVEESHSCIHRTLHDLSLQPIIIQLQFFVNYVNLSNYYVY